MSVDRVAEVLVEHVHDRGYGRCECGAEAPNKYVWADHVAAVLEAERENGYEQ